MAQTRREIKVVDKSTGVEYSGFFEQSARDTEPGVYLFIKVNQLGSQYLQQKFGIDPFVSNEAAGEWFCQKTGMPKEGLNSLGNLKKETWWEVVDSGAVIHEGITPVAPIALEAPMMVAAVADTTPTKKSKKKVAEVAKTDVAETPTN